MKTTHIFISALLLLCLAACDSDHHGRIYTSMDTDECSRLRFACQAGQVAFSDSTGCGCETVNPDALMDQKTRNSPSDDNILPNSPQYNNTVPPADQDPNADDRIRSDEDPIDRNLDDIQDRRLETRD